MYSTLKGTKTVKQQSGVSFNGFCNAQILLSIGTGNTLRNRAPVIRAGTTKENIS
jgi:hypothetical protein